MQDAKKTKAQLLEDLACLRQRSMAMERREAEAQAQQAATREILRLIASSPTDVQPVFDAIATRAVTLCEALNGGVFRFDGRLIHLVAHYNWSPADLEIIQRVFPIPPGRGSVTARAILTGAVAHVPDVTTDSEYVYSSLAQTGLRTTLSVPMMRDGHPIGAITATRREVKPFSDSQITLLQTFADQAVIAIENARLFQELEARNSELTEALEQQTATSEVLRVISSSPNDVQPVFDMIAQNAVRLCDAQNCAVFQFDGELIHFVGHYGVSPEGVEANRQAFPRPAGQDTAVGRAILTRAIAYIPDVHADPAYGTLSVA